MISFIINLFIAILACVCVVCRFKDIVLRTGLVICVAIASLISFWLITLYAGKPLESIAPDDMIVYGQAIDIQNSKIYILQRKPNDGFPPILIELPYEKKLGDALKGGAEQSEGKPFRLQKKAGKKGDGEQDGDGEGSGESDNGGAMSQKSETWEIMPLPPPRLPDKKRW